MKYCLSGKRCGTIRAMLPLFVLMAVFYMPALVGAAPETAADKIITLDGWLKHRVGLYMEVLIDEERTLSIQDVSGPEWDNNFQPVHAEIPNFLITEAAVWTRFTLYNPLDQAQQKYLSFEFPLADHVSFFIPRGSEFERMDAGYAVAGSEKLVPNRFYVFPFTVDAGEKMTCYIRVLSNANMVLPMTIWNPAALDRKDHSDQMIFGIIFGILFAFIAYFAAMALKLKNSAAMWFTFYIACLGLLLSCYLGYLQELLRPASADVNKLLIITLIGCLYFTGAKFLRTFLNISFYSRRIDRVIQALQWMGLVFIPVNLFTNPWVSLYGFILVGIGPLFSTFVSVFFWIKGVPNARYFAIGWIIGHLTSELDLLRVMGVIPWMPGDVYLIPAAMISAIVFFSIAIIEQSREYRDRAMKDGLTGVANRRHFDEVLDIEWRRYLRNQRPLSIIMADIDDFKAFNDHYGHIWGDNCLKAVGGVFSKTVRRVGDLAARYGGEEFVVLLPETESDQAAVLAEKLRAAVEDLSIIHAASRAAGVVTMSLGTGTMVPEMEKSPADLVDHADKALYQAKKKGRNCVVSAG